MAPIEVRASIYALRAGAHNSVHGTRVMRGLEILSPVSQDQWKTLTVTAKRLLAEALASENKFSMIAASTMKGKCEFIELTGRQCVDVEQEDPSPPTPKACLGYVMGDKTWLPRQRAACQCPQGQRPCRDPCWRRLRRAH